MCLAAYHGVLVAMERKEVKLGEDLENILEGANSRSLCFWEGQGARTLSYIPAGRARLCGLHVAPAQSWGNAGLVCPTEATTSTREPQAP